MDAVTLTEVGADDEAVRFRLYAEVRAEELGMQGWNPDERTQMLRLQFEAQRRGYRDQFPAAAVRLILCDGSPVGWVIVDRSGPDLRCVDIAIVSGDRSKGIGTRVLRALQEEAAAGDRPLALTVLRTNVRALAFYARLGFRAIRQTDTHALMEWRRDSTHSAIR